MRDTKALKFDTNGIFTVVSVNSLDDYYREIDCECIDFARRVINGKTYDIAVDDEGLLKESPIVTALSLFNSYNALVGNLLIFKGVDRDGNMIGITDDDVKNIKAAARNKLCIDDGTVSTVIMLD